MVRILAAVAARMSFGLSPMPRAASGSMPSRRRVSLCMSGAGFGGRDASGRGSSRSGARRRAVPNAARIGASQLALTIASAMPRRGGEVEELGARRGARWRARRRRARSVRGPRAPGRARRRRGRARSARERLVERDEETERVALLRDGLGIETLGAVERHDLGARALPVDPAPEVGERVVEVENQRAERSRFRGAHAIGPSRRAAPAERHEHVLVELEPHLVQRVDARARDEARVAGRDRRRRRRRSAVDRAPGAARSRRARPRPRRPSRPPPSRGRCAAGLSAADASCQAVIAALSSRSATRKRS